MFERLKSLPLTIVLTILIWMYAESQVNSTPGTTRLTVENVPVLVSGPPEVISPIQVEIVPGTITVTVSGPQELIDRLRQRIARGGVKNSGIFAYLDIDAGDQPTGAMVRRQLRFSFPEGIVLHEAPLDVTCRITRAQAAAPSASEAF